MREKPENAEAIIHADHHDAFVRKVFAILAPFRRGAGLKSAAVDPYHYRQLCGRGDLRRPHIEIQTIFARPAVAKRHVTEDVSLHAARAKFGGLANSLPRRNGLGFFPAQRANRWRGERNSLKNLHFAVST